MIITDLGDDLFVVGGTDVNWIIARDGDQLTLVDGGYPGDADDVIDSILAIGSDPRDIAAVLLTHGHVDHVGALGRLHHDHGIAIYASAAEVEHLRAGDREQARPVDVAIRSWRPRILAWSLRIMKAGGMEQPDLSFLQPFPTAGADGALDLPGRPVVVPTPGHTSGHSAYLFADHGAVASGDALITGHATTGLDGPHLLPDFFCHHPAEVETSLEALRGLDADLLLPGHGPHLRTSMGAAVDRARA